MGGNKLVINNLDDGQSLAVHFDPDIRKDSDNSDLEFIKGYIQYAIDQNDEKYALQALKGLEAGADANNICEQAYKVKGRFRYNTSYLAYIAASKGWTKVIKQMAELAIPLDFPPKIDVWRPIHIAACKGHFAIFNIILQKHPDSINETKELRASPLFYAIDGGSIEILKIIVEHNDTKSIWKTESHYTSLGRRGIYAPMHAYNQNRLEMIQLLVKHGGRTDGLPQWLLDLVNSKENILEKFKLLALDINKLNRAYAFSEKIAALLFDNNITHTLAELKDNQNLDVICDYYSFDILCRLAKIDLKHGGHEAYKEAYKLYGYVAACKFAKENNHEKAEAIRNKLNEKNFKASELTEVLVGKASGSATSATLSFMRSVFEHGNTAYHRIPDSIKKHFSIQKL